MLLGRMVASTEKSFHDVIWGKVNQCKPDTQSTNSAFKRKILSDIGYYNEDFETGSEQTFAGEQQMQVIGFYITLRLQFLMIGEI